MTDQAPPGIGIRRGSIVLRYPAFADVAVVLNAHPEMGAYTLYDDGMPPKWIHPSRLRLELKDPTGFMHGVWAVAERFGDTSCTATVEHRYGFWEVKTTAGIIRFCAYSGKASEPARIVVPDLRNIQPSQPQQALAAIMRHVFGVEND